MRGLEIKEQRVLEHMSKLRKKYLTALKTLDGLQASYLAEIKKAKKT